MDALGHPVVSDHGASGHNNRPLERAFKFPNVAGPVVFGKQPLASSASEYSLPDLSRARSKK